MKEVNVKETTEKVKNAVVDKTKKAKDWVKTHKGIVIASIGGALTATIGGYIAGKKNAENEDHIVENEEGQIVAVVRDNTLYTVECLDETSNVE